MEALRELWLENADVDVLLSAEAGAPVEQVVPQAPVLGRGGDRPVPAITDLEVRQKLSLFVRSRWFRPPLDGRIMAGLMYDAVTWGPRRTAGSLLPSGQLLDLFVTLTDYYGYQELVQIHDPPLIHELDHHHVLHFTYRRHSNGDVESDFELDNAQASPSPRARPRRSRRLPPARIVEMDEVVAQRQGGWPRRAEFIAKEFPAICAPRSIPPRRRSSMARCSTTGRSAGDRGDPRPAGLSRGRSAAGLHRSPPGAAGLAAATAGSGLLRDAARRALGYPELAAGADELARVIEFNDQVRRLRAIIDSARPHVGELVTQVVTTTFDRAISTDDVRGWREQVNAHVARDAGRLPGLCPAQARVGARLRRRADRQAAGHACAIPMSRLVAEIIDAWAVRKGIVYERADSAALEFETQTADHLPAWVKYLLAFDVKYRERRLQFLIEGQNRLYQLLGQGTSPGSTRSRSTASSANSMPASTPCVGGNRRVLWRRGARAGGRHFPGRALVG